MQRPGSTVLAVSVDEGLGFDRRAPNPYRWVSCLVLVLLIAPRSVTTAEEFIGSIEPGLIAGNPGFPVSCKRVSRTADDGLPETGDAEVFRGSLWWLLRGSRELRVPVLLVEPRGNRSPLVYIDMDRNGRFAVDEQFVFAKTRRRDERGELSLHLPAPAGGVFKQFPVRLVLPVRSYATTSVPPADRYLLQSIGLYVSARVRVGSRQLFFRYGVLPDVRTLDPTRTTHLVNTGRLNERHLSPSRATGHGEAPVFRIGNHYVSTESVDLDRRIVRLRARDPREYRRLELRPGLVIPDFTFEDLDGKPRQLSEFRGHYVLLNFWYPHCGPCVDELRRLRVAQERYRSRGLTVVGLSTTGTAPVLSNGFRLSPDSIKGFLAEHGISRVEATPRSVSRIVREWFMIEGSPTMILLDPRGRVLSLNQSPEGKLPLRGAALLETLDRVLPR